MKSAVVTGIGIITPLGHSLDEFWGNIRAGKSGISKVDRFDIERFESQIAAQVRGFDPSGYMDKK